MSLKRTAQDALLVIPSDCKSPQKKTRTESPSAQDETISMWQPPSSILRRAKSTPEIYVSESLSLISNESETDGIVKPNDNDVLCKRGGRVIKNPGNVKYRKLIESKRQMFQSCSQEYRTVVAMSIVDSIYHQDPPGRFLHQDSKTGLWFDVGKMKAIQKTSVALSTTRKTKNEEPKPTSPQEKSEKPEVTDTESNADDQEDKGTVSDGDGKSLTAKESADKSKSKQDENEISELTNEDNLVPLPYCRKEDTPAPYDNDFVAFMNNKQVLYALFDGDAISTK